MEGGRFKTVAVVGSTLTSASLNREVYTAEVVPEPGRKPLNAYLSAYVFGDGAGAVVLRADGEEGTGILASMSGNARGELVLRRGGGMMKLPYQGRARPGDMAFVVDGQKVAVYREESGTCHAVSPVCTHVGCHVHWNNAERSWDCPCHGARYSPTGKVLNGPAVKDLASKPLPAEASNSPTTHGEKP